MTREGNGTQSTDVAVIGAGPGGYVAALRAAQLGKKVVVIDRDQLGGTCLNYGCIPSKALLDSTALFHKLDEMGEDHGILASNLRYDLTRMMGRKRRIVETQVKGIASLLRSSQVEFKKASARFKDANTLELATADGSTSLLRADAIVIATGSVVTVPPGMEIDKKILISSTEALSLEAVPGTMAVIGGGFIGLEIGSVYRRLGTEVTVIEMLDTILPGQDADVVMLVDKLLRKQGMTIRTSHKVTNVVREESGAKLTVTPTYGGEAFELSVEKVLVAVGRKPTTDGLEPDVIGLARRRDGSLEVNSKLQTNVPHVYAIGDAAGGKLLAHKASKEGIVAAEAIAGLPVEHDGRIMPFAVFIEPEVGCVGLTEKEARDAGRKLRIGNFPYRASGKARCLGETEGFVKVIGDADTDELLGVHVVGAHAADLIGEASFAMEAQASLEDLHLTTHVHPTLSEMFSEAALAAHGRAIHLAYEPAKAAAALLAAKA
ncbi:MAG: dihydrolipoyl dehydrogenase [Planctomycetes bacterium]|nr:dihydrolipoyl dehydrogenase [Planctomycetota bacterium]